MAKNQHFFPCRKNYALGLGKIKLCAPAVGAKIWCLFVTLGLRARGHSLNKYCVMVYGSILMLFSLFFSEVIALSEALESSRTRRQVAPQFLRNCC